MYHVLASKMTLLTKINVTRHLIQKSLQICQLLPFEYRFYAYDRFSFGFFTKNSCFVTDRHRGYTSLLGVSRLVFKNYCMRAYYPGFRRIVW